MKALTTLLFIPLLLLCLAAVASPTGRKILVQYTVERLEYKVTCHCSNSTTVILGTEEGDLLKATERGKISLLYRFHTPVLACDISSDKVFVGLSNGSVCYVSLGSPGAVKCLRAYDSSKERLERLAVSPGGEIIALAVKYRYLNRYPASRITFLNATTGELVASRDPESDPMLVRLFSFIRIGDLLVLQTLDTFCEICEYTDNMLEVYNITSLKILYRVKIGLSLLSVDSERGKLVLVRMLREPDGSHQVLVYDLLSGAEEKSFKIHGEPNYILASGGLMVVLLDGEKLVIYDYGRGARLKGTTYSDVLSIGTTILNGERFLTILGKRRIAILDTSLSNLWSTEVERECRLSPPVAISLHNATLMAVYSGMYCSSSSIYTLKVFNKIRLKITVLDIKGEPIRGANVTLIAYNPYNISFYHTDSSGHVFFTLFPDQKVEIRVKAKDYKPYRLVLDLEKLTLQRPFLSINITLGGLESKGSVVVHVTWHGEPLANATVTVEGEGVKDVCLTNSSGFCSIENIPAYLVLNISAVKEGFRPESKAIIVQEGDNIISFELLRKNLGLRIRVNKTDMCTVKVFKKNKAKTPVGEYKVVNGSLALTLDEGYYELEVTCGRWRNITSLYLRNDCELTFSPVSHAEEASGTRQVLEGVLSLIKKHVLHTYSPPNLTVEVIELAAPDGSRELVDLGGDTIYVIEFFYTKCWGCEKLIPVLQELKQRYPGVVKPILVTIYPSDTYEDIQYYAREHNVTIEIYRDLKGFHEMLGVTVVPSVAVIYNGKVVYLGIGARDSITGNFTSNETILELLELGRRYANLIFSLSLLVLIFILAWNKMRGDIS